MSSVVGLIVRECNPAGDAIALQALDTSISSEKCYEVRAQRDDLTLRLRTLPEPRRKQFVIDPSTPVWSRGWVAEIDQGVRGFIATRFEPWNRRLAIWHFYVDALYRRRGIGTCLMQRALQDGRAQGARTAWVETSNDNHPGVQIYQRLGFTLCGFDLSLYNGTPNEDEFALYLALQLTTDH